MQAAFTTFEEKLIVSSRLEKAEEGVYCVKFEKVAGSKMDFLETYGELRTTLTEANMIIA